VTVIVKMFTCGWPACKLQLYDPVLWILCQLRDGRLELEGENQSNMEFL